MSNLLGGQLKYKLQSFYRIFSYLAIISIFIANTSCRAFKQDKLFQSEEGVNSSSFDQKLASLKEDYSIKKFDLLAINVFPNNGEQLVDKTGDYPMGGGNGNRGNMGMNGNNNNRFNNNGQGVQGESLISLMVLQNNLGMPIYYAVNDLGELTLPVIGAMPVEGLKLTQLDSLLKVQYSSYIKDPYVTSQFVNKRVILMGALGDQIISLPNNGVNLMEVISIASGQGNLQSRGRANKIKIIRGKPGIREVLNVDLTTMAGLNKLETNVMPGDIIYIPPRRRLDRQTLSDISAIFSPITSVLTLILLFNRL